MNSFQNYKILIKTRRQLYRKFAFLKLKAAFELTVKYKLYNNQFVLMKRALSAFLIIKQKNHQLRLSKHLLFVFQQETLLNNSFRYWIKMIHLKRKFKYISNRFKIYQKNIFFCKWLTLSRVKLQNRKKFINCKKSLQRITVAKYFDNWFYQFEYQQHLNDCSFSIKETINYTMIFTFFSTWKKYYKRNRGLRNAQVQYENFLSIFPQERYFHKWFIAFQMENKTKHHIHMVETIFNDFTLYRCFSKWNAKLLAIQKIKNQIIQTQLKLNFFKQGRYFSNWQILYKDRSSHHQNYSKAIECYRYILLIKSLQGFLLYTQYEKNKIAQYGKMKYFYEHKLLIKILRKWRDVQYQNKRIRTLVYCSLKLFCNKIKRKYVLKWKSFIDLKHQNHQDYLIAKKDYKKFKISSVLSGFLSNASKIPLPKPIMLNYSNSNPNLFLEPHESQPLDSYPISLESSSLSINDSSYIHDQCCSLSNMIMLDPGNPIPVSQLVQLSHMINQNYFCKN